MSYGVVGEVYSTADAAANPPAIGHQFSMHNFFELKAIRTQIVKFASPTFDYLALELRAVRQDGTIGEVISTATKTWTLADISAANYSCAEIWFDWDQPVLLGRDVHYVFTLKLANYVGDDLNHIAWVHSWPDPIVPFFGSTGYNQISTFPFQVAIIGREVLP